MSDFEPSGFVVFRSSLLPYDAFLKFEGRETLKELVSLPEVREALFLASPSLEESLEHWEKDPASERGLKVESTLVKYFARMSARPTPFGLFSGITLGRTGPKTTLRLAARAKNRRATRLDGELLASLAQLLARELADRIRFEPNTSLYRAAGRLRFSSWRKTEQGRSFDLVAIEPAPHVEAALERARGGALLAEIGEAIAARSGVSSEEGTEFAKLLAEKQVLVPLLEPFVTADEPLLGILEPLREVSPERAKPLEQIRATLRDLDERIGNAPARYRELARNVEALGAPFELPRLFQVDMVKPGEVTLGPRVLEELERAVSLAHRLFAARDEADLERFKQDFLERYEGRSVPLVEALDEESGIGFLRGSSSEPLLRGLVLSSGGEETSAFTRRDAFLLEKLLARPRVLELTDDDLKALEPRGAKPPLPDAFSVVATLAARSEDALDRGEFSLVLASVLGPSGATLLGRFAHTDAALREALRAHVKAEERARPDAIFAEVAHLPEGRLGNVIFRPVLREWEIAFLGRSGAARTIPITDLLVSLEEGRVVLRSARLGKEVVPRITCAFNLQHRASQPLLRFLGALQTQGVAGVLGFGWGALANAPFLPRVSHGKCVLSLARWNVSARAFESVKKAKKPERAAAFAKWREELALPRRVALADADNVLPLDLESPFSQEVLLQLVKERAAFSLVEIFPEPEEICLRGVEGGFHHEVVVPFVRKGKEAGRAGPAGANTERSRANSERSGVGAGANSESSGVGSERAAVGGATNTESSGPNTETSADAAANSERSAGAGTATNTESSRPNTESSPSSRETRLVPRGKRSFPPGSECLFVKLYGGAGTADTVLRTLVEPLVQEALASGLAERWFFIRFADPRPHLRVRFFGPRATELLPRLEERSRRLLDQGRIARIQLDTYERELERYGDEAGVLLAEQVFQADSACALALVAATPGDAGADSRWRLLVRGIDQLLEDLGLDLAARRAFAKREKEGYGRELGADDAFWRQLGQRYRKERGSLEALLDRSQDASSPHAAALAALAQRSEAIRPLVPALRALPVPLTALASSYVHMHANRLLRAAARMQEACLHYLLERLYEARIARGKQ